jgi:regulatory protein
MMANQDRAAQKITALTLQKRNRNRVNVHLDGEYAFGLARIVAAWLQIGQELSEADIARLKEEDEREVAYAKALSLLNHRPRSEKEIRQNLRKNGFRDEIQEYVLARLDRAGLINDQQFAETWVQNRSDMRPRSRRALAYELAQRGLPEEIVREAVDSVDDEALAYEAASRQARKLAGLEWQDFRQKMYGFLARRGFNYEVSASAAARAWADLHDDNPAEGDSSDPTA